MRPFPSLNGWTASKCAWATAMRVMGLCVTACMPSQRIKATVCSRQART